MYHKTLAYRWFNAFNQLLLIIVSLLCILPLLHVFAVSLSGKAAATANIVNLWPIDFTLESYLKTVNNPEFYPFIVLSRCTGPFWEPGSEWLLPFLQATRCPRNIPSLKAGMFICGFSYLRCYFQADSFRAIF